MLYLSAVLVIGLISIFENGQTLGYSYKFTAITTPCKAIQTRSTRSLTHRLPAAQIDTGASEEPKSGGIPPWVAPFSTAAMGGLLFGSDIGCSSSVVRILGSKSGEFGALSALELGQIASSSLFGAMIASGLLVYLGDAKIGRKLEFQLASLLFFVGTLIQSLSPTLSLVYLGTTFYRLFSAWSRISFWFWYCDDILFVWKCFSFIFQLLFIFVFKHYLKFCSSDDCNFWFPFNMLQNRIFLDIVIFSRIIIVIFIEFHHSTNIHPINPNY